MRRKIQLRNSARRKAESVLHGLLLLVCLAAAPPGSTRTGVDQPTGIKDLAAGVREGSQKIYRINGGNYDALVNALISHYDGYYRRHDNQELFITNHGGELNAIDNCQLPGGRYFSDISILQNGTMTNRFAVLGATNTSNLTIIANIAYQFK